MSDFVISALVPAHQPAVWTGGSLGFGPLWGVMGGVSSLAATRVTSLLFGSFLGVNSFMCTGSLKLSQPLWEWIMGCAPVSLPRSLLCTCVSAGCGQPPALERGGGLEEAPHSSLCPPATWISRVVGGRGVPGGPSRGISSDCPPLRVTAGAPDSSVKFCLYLQPFLPVIQPEGLRCPEPLPSLHPRPALISLAYLAQALAVYSPGCVASRSCPWAGWVLAHTAESWGLCAASHLRGEAV